MATLDRSIEKQVQERLRTLLLEVPFIGLKDWREEARLGTAKVDFVLDLVAGGERWRLLVECKGTGEPRIVRSAIQELQELVAGQRKAYGVVAAPYISTRGAEICKASGVGFLDLAGNCRLVFGQVFVERRGLPNLKVERRPLRTLFAPRASRVIRVLFEEPKRSWQVQELAKQARVSLGLAFKVKERLLDLEYAREEEDGIRLARPEALVREWTSVYSYQKNAALDCYGLLEVPDLEAALSNYCRTRGIRYALALFSGAARIAAFTRYARAFAYVAADAADVARELGLKPVPSGANFTIMTPFDEGVLYGAQEVDGATVVSDVQLYLDLAGYKGRGEEAAEFIFEKRLRPRW